MSQGYGVTMATYFKYNFEKQFFNGANVSLVLIPDYPFILKDSYAAATQAVGLINCHSRASHTANYLTVAERLLGNNYCLLG